MRKLLLMVLATLVFLLTVAPTTACFVTGGGTLGDPVTDAFGGIATVEKNGIITGEWTHSVPGEFTFHGTVDDMSCYAPDEALIFGMGDYNGRRVWFEIRVRDGDVDHYEFKIYTHSSPGTLYFAEGDLSRGSITIHPSNNGHPPPYAPP